MGERKKSWVGREMRGILEKLEEGKNMIKIYCMRKVSIKKLKKKRDHIKYEFIYINMAGTGNSTETVVGERLTEARRE